MTEENHSAPDIYDSFSDFIVDDIFRIGEVWKIRDCLIKIPDADRLDNRNEHFCRTVVIIDNNQENSNKMYPVITIAPLSHRTDCLREFDIELDKERNNLDRDSILRVSLAQPVLKADLYEKVATLHQDNIYKIIDIQLEKVGVDPSDLNL